MDNKLSDRGGSSWSIAIFSSRESVEVLKDSIASAMLAARGRQVCIDILVNGNRLLADEIDALLKKGVLHEHGEEIRLWFIPLGDKAHTWNEYLNRIWQGSGIVFFIDGYVVLAEDSLRLLEIGLNQDPHALGATGVPTVGRTATALRDQMLREGGIHGNLYSMRGRVLSELKKRDFRLPLGIYRGDPLLAAVMCFGLDPAQNAWDSSRVFVHPNATWSVRQLPWWSPASLKGQWKRKLRQAQGILENRAVQTHLAVLRQRPETLPRTVEKLVDTWIRFDRKMAVSTFLRNPLCYYARLKLNNGRDWSIGDREPQQLFSGVCKSRSASATKNV